MFEFVQKLGVVDLLRSGALVVVFLATAFADKRGQQSVWVKVDALTSAATGLALFLCPGILLAYEVDGEANNLLVYLARAVGVTMMSTAAVYHLTIRERDNASMGSWLVARTLSCGAVLAVFVHAMNAYSNLNDKFISFGVLGQFLMFAGHVIHLFRYNDFVNDGRGGAATAGDRTKLHLFIDLLFSFTYMMHSFAFPESALAVSSTKASGLHFMFLRYMGANLMTSSLFGLVSLQSNNERDRRAVLLSRLLIVLLMTPVFIFYQHFYGIVSMQGKQVWLMLGLHTLLLVNAGMGAFYRQIEERKRK